jgi:hypothetical protein
MKRLEWREPASYQRARNREISGAPQWWMTHVIALGSAGGVFALFQIGKFSRGGRSEMTTEVALAISVGIGVLVGYLFPILAIFTSRRVWTDNKGLHRRHVTGGQTTEETLAWEHIVDYKIERAVYAGKGFDELRVKTSGGGEWLIGLDGKQLRSQLDEVFRAHAQGGKAGS